MLLAGKRCVISGGASGIGAGTAVVLANHGAQVAVLDVRLDQAESLVASLPGSEAGAHMAAEVDVADVASVERAFSAVEEVLPDIDGLVNCAGIRITGGLLDASPEDWNKVLEVNLSGAFYCSQQAGRRMVQRGSGSIVNIASAAAIVGVDKRVAYNASKSGMLGLTRSLARDLGHDGIRANAVCPGMIRTPLTEPYFEDQQWVDGLKDVIPLGTIGEPEQIGEAVAFLISDMAAYITGIALPVDGGFTSYGSFGKPSAFTDDRGAR